MRFENKTVIVTGASRGIGLATAARFHSEGANVALFARNADRLAKIADGEERYHPVAGDVSSKEDVDRLFDECIETFGEPHILINNAGIVEGAEVSEMSERVWDQHFDVNVKGVFLCTRRAVPLMRSAGGGSIVNVASISGVLGPSKFPGFSAYAASKAAVIMLTEALAPELGPQGIRVNCVSPGSVETDMFASVAPGVEADMQPEEIASTIAWLCSSEARPVNGQNIHVYSA